MMNRLIRAVCERADLGNPIRRTSVGGKRTHLVVHLVTASGAYAVRLVPEGAPTEFLTSGDAQTRLTERAAIWGVAPPFVDSGTIRVDGRTWRYTIVEWLAARRLTYSRADVVAAARTLAALHRQSRASRIPPVRVDDLREYFRRQSPRNPLGRSTAPLLDLIRQEWAEGSRRLDRDKVAGSAPSCVVHNDLVANNIVMARQRAWLIDWEWAVRASPALDICGFLSPFVTSWGCERFLSDETVSLFLGSYFAASPPGIVDRLRGESARIWRAYNAMVARWLCCQTRSDRPHLRKRSFYHRAFRRVRAIQGVIDGSS